MEPAQNSMHSAETSLLGLLVPLHRDADKNAAIANFGSIRGCTTINGLDDTDLDGIKVVSNAGKIFVTRRWEDPFPICKLWAQMALTAFEQDNVTAVILLGDDVIILDDRSLVHEVSQCLMNNVCVSIVELQAPGWPSFVAVRRDHLTIIESFIPHDFVNQDGDIFLFELWRRGGLATATKNIHLVNGRGGVRGNLQQPYHKTAYKPVHCEWRGPLLGGYLTKIDAGTRCATLDVTVPMGRPNVHFIEALLKLPVPQGMDRRVCICLDGAVSPNEWKQFRSMEKQVSDLRIRLNEVNLGAPMTRNRLLQERHSEWILFPGR
mmetsp:Transcript_2119/g.6322  ORF Transcript_2119/g.6322 Transcript_2119/m.6322 type:complete len:321 (+) Transcript_2119:1648-2610(+)